jgi:hypothetical protein
LTSVTASWETLSHLLVEQTIEHPENNLWIMEADDPNLDSRIITAVVHGQCQAINAVYSLSLKWMHIEEV